jgi:hypothetical protein
VKDVLKHSVLYLGTHCQCFLTHSSVNGDIMHCDKIAYSLVATHKIREFFSQTYPMFWHYFRFVCKERQLAKETPFGMFVSVSVDVLFPSSCNSDR